MSKSRIAFQLALCLAFPYACLHAACDTPQCEQATAWQAGYTAVVLKQGTPPDVQYAAETAIRAAGGTIAIITDELFLGWIRPAAVRALIGTHNIALITQRPVDIDSVAPSGSRAAERTRNMLRFFNDVASGREADRVQRSLGDIVGPPLTGDGMQSFPPPTSTAHTGTGLRSTANSATFCPWPNDVMAGRIVVQAFAMESDGSHDANLYGWWPTYPVGSDSDWMNWSNQVNSTFSFWVNEAASRSITLSFLPMTWHWTEGNCQTGYEPVLHGFAEDYLYINEILSKQTASYVGGRAGGFGASPVNRQNIQAKVQEYNQYQLSLSWYGAPATHAFTVFATGNTGSAPKTFAGSFRSYTEFGLYANTLYDNAGWGPNNYYRVLRHETGHVFWACDEYYNTSDGTGCQSCFGCYGAGPRVNVPNGNCNRAGASGPCNPAQTSCMMKDSVDLLCGYTSAQVGW